MCLCFNPMHWESDLDYVATDRKNVRGEKVGPTDQKRRSSFLQRTGAPENRLSAPHLLAGKMAWRGAASTCTAHPPVTRPGPEHRQAIWLMRTKERHSKATSR